MQRILLNVIKKNVFITLKVKSITTNLVLPKIIFFYILPAKVINYCFYFNNLIITVIRRKIIKFLAEN